MEFHIFNKQHYSYNIYLCSYPEFEITQYVSLLNQEEKLRFESFKSENRKREYLATRILIQKYFPGQHIKYSAIGAPYLNAQNTYISISHGKNMVAIMASEEHLVGIDLEYLSEKAQRLKEKFLNVEEQKLFTDIPSHDYTKLWSIKETLYKLAERKKIDFRKDLLILSYQDQVYSCKINNPDSSKFSRIRIFEFNKHIISHNIY